RPGPRGAGTYKVEHGSQAVDVLAHQHRRVRPSGLRNLHLFHLPPCATPAVHPRRCDGIEQASADVVPSRDTRGDVRRLTVDRNPEQLYDLDSGVSVPEELVLLYHFDGFVDAGS